MTVGAAFVTSLLVGITLQPLLIERLRRHGIVDVPSARSSHVAITPRGGGVAVVAALAAGLLVSRGADKETVVVLCGALVLGAVGLTDDVRGLSAHVRLAILTVVGGLTGLLLNPSLPQLLGVAVMAVWVTAYVNAFNFMDGINGISGLSGFVAGLAYSLMGGELGSSALQIIGIALAGACLSFLPFNLMQARVFLGDVGSYALGFVIACCAWLAWAGGASVMLALAPTGVYLVDTGLTLVRRARARRPLLQAHREHIYQQLVQSGQPHFAVAILVSGLAASVTGLAWLATSTSHRMAATLLIAALLAGYAAAPTLSIAWGNRS